MKTLTKQVNVLSLMLACMLLACALAACSSTTTQTSAKAADQEASGQIDTSHFLCVVDDEPDTVDFQCTSIYYTVAINSFNGLVGVETNEAGDAIIVPALAESWEVSDDRRSYTFHLREGVQFSNGSPLTSSDVLYSFTRLLTHPDSCNSDIVDEIVGADQLKSGQASELAGLEVINDRDFTITLGQPFEAFLSCLPMPGASILDKETVEAAGDRFGKDPECTIGTGPFILYKWEPGEGMLFKANPHCWEGPPKCAFLDVRFIKEPVEIRTRF